MEALAQYRETSAQYGEFAKECDRLAKHAKTEHQRKTLEEMAEAWRIVAAEADNKR
jgi:capsid protein